MVDTKNPGDKTLSVSPSKTLTLKPRVEQGTVRQSFSHGRTKQVVVEKRGKRRGGRVTGRPQGARRQDPAGASCDISPSTCQFGRGAADIDRGRAQRTRQRAGRGQGPRRGRAPACRS